MSEFEGERPASRRLRRLSRSGTPLPAPLAAPAALAGGCCGDDGGLLAPSEEAERGSGEAGPVKPTSAAAETARTGTGEVAAAAFALAPLPESGDAVPYSETDRNAAARTGIPPVVPEAAVGLVAAGAGDTSRPPAALSVPP
jgi:hypothetical protein